MKGFFPPPVTSRRGEKMSLESRLGLLLVCLFPFLSLSDVPAYKSFWNSESKVKQCVL